jgi:hypothetical protein
MCSSKPLKFGLLIPLVLVGLLIFNNIPELRRYLRIASM